ncbi:MAG: hypothetical protein ACRCUB_19260, partial [Plesiomonas shigelloides]
PPNDCLYSRCTGQSSCSDLSVRKSIRRNILNRPKKHDLHQNMSHSSADEKYWRNYSEKREIKSRFNHFANIDSAELSVNELIVNEPSINQPSAN